MSLEYSSSLWDLDRRMAGYVPQVWIAIDDIYGLDVAMDKAAKLTSKIKFDDKEQGCAAIYTGK